MAVVGRPNTQPATGDASRKMGPTLSRLIASGARTIEEVRAFLLAHYAW
jgi:hypothetical protein